jgi:hypothetical protein
MSCPAAELQVVESVILACPESFCFKEGFPPSGNDKQNKNIIQRGRASRNSLIKGFEESRSPNLAND